MLSIDENWKEDMGDLMDRYIETGGMEPIFRLVKWARSKFFSLHH